MKLNYRDDIDGLRAISVLAVIFNHIGVSLFSGGFIGVDVFFVISGYLITTIIIKDIYSNEFSLIKFYERRIRRIFPALFTVITFTVIICSIIYQPEKFKEFSKSLIATTLFVSNINFWKESGYFDTSSQLKPLLHTWSLAVEEQFYIFFPLFMLGLIRYVKKYVSFILTIVAIISFGLSTYMLSKDPTATFYLAHLRAWELIIGAIVALNIFSSDLGKRYSNLLGVVGISLILIPVFQYSKDTPFPGLAALAPVIGSALIIFGDNEGKSLIAKVLSTPALVFIGKISYSLYLWHWPLIIFTKYYAIRPITNLETTLLLGIIFILSSISWRFIETPFRSKSFLKTKQIFTFATSAMVLMVFTGTIVYKNQGFPNRNKMNLEIDNVEGNERWKFEKCDVNYDDPISMPTTITFCDVGNKSQSPSFLVWGDSHAPALGKAIHISALTAGFAGILSYDPGCPSLLDMLPYPPKGNVPCPEYNHMMIQYLSKHPEIQVIILINRWTVWAEGTPYQQEEGPSKFYLTDVLNELPQNTSSEDELFTRGLERTIKALVDLDRQIIIVSPTPEIGYDVPSANFIATLTGRDANEIIAPTLNEYLVRNQKTFNILYAFKDKYKVQMVEPWKILCAEKICRVSIDGISVYKDDDHLSAFGSELIAPVFNPVFKLIQK